MDTLMTDDMEGKPSVQSTPLVERTDKIIVTIVRRSLQTAIDAKAACDDPARGLLALSGKCAAMYASLDSNSKRHPMAVRRLSAILSPLSDMLSNVKQVVRNTKEWVAPGDQQEAFDLVGLHLEECHRVLLLINTEKNAKSAWPEFKVNETLEKRTAAFTAKCDRQRGLTSQGQQQPVTRQTKYFKGYPAYTRSGSRSICSTAALSDDELTSSSSPLSPPSSASASLLSLSSFTFPGSENITVRPSSLSRWAQIEDNSAQSSTTTPTPTPTPSVRAVEGSSLRRQNRKKLQTKVSVSPGAAFVPYRSPTRLAEPKGTSLRGSGAIATRKRRVW